MNLWPINNALIHAAEDAQKKLLIHSCILHETWQSSTFCNHYDESPFVCDEVIFSLLRDGQKMKDIWSTTSWTPSPLSALYHSSGSAEPFNPKVSRAMMQVEIGPRTPKWDACWELQCDHQLRVMDIAFPSLILKAHVRGNPWEAWKCACQVE